MTVRVSHDRNTLGQGLANGLLYAGVGGGLAAVMAAIVVPRIVGQLGHHAGLYAALMMATIPLAAFSEFLFAGLLALEKTVEFNLLRVLQPALLLAGAVVAVVLGRMTPGIFLAILLAASPIVSKAARC